MDLPMIPNMASILSPEEMREANVRSARGIHAGRQDDHRQLLQQGN